MDDRTQSPSKAGVGVYEGVFYALCSVGGWLAYNGFVFVVTLFVVSATRTAIPWRGWAFVAVISCGPLFFLGWLGVRRLQCGALIPTTLFGKEIFWVQVGGVVGLTAALITPPVFLWSYLHPGGRLRVENPTQYAFSLELQTDQQECDVSVFIKPSTDVTTDLRPQDSLGFDCFGVAIKSFDIAFAYGTWTCAWPVQQTLQPVVLSDGGPSCEVLSFKPGYLNPPVSPPPALPPGETSPFSPPPAE